MRHLTEELSDVRCKNVAAKNFGEGYFFQTCITATFVQSCKPLAQPSEDFPATACPVMKQIPKHGFMEWKTMQISCNLKMQKVVT